MTEGLTLELKLPLIFLLVKVSPGKR